MELRALVFLCRLALGCVAHSWGALLSGPPAELPLPGSLFDMETAPGGGGA